MWQRMEQIFGAKWSARQGDVFDEKNRYSLNFLTWCEKTQRLTAAEWRHGVDAVERRAVEQVQAGETAWPPTYVEFLGLSILPPPAPEHRIFPRLALEDKTAREKRRQLGLARCGELKKLFE